MPDYKEGKIYSIRSHLTDDIYIGSTTSPLSTRMVSHRTKFKNGIYITSHEILKHGDAYIELVEDYPCDNKEQLHRREGQVIRATEKCVNKSIPCRTPAERYQDNKEAYLQRIKEFQATHREQINQRKRERYALMKAQKITSQNIICPDNIECQPNSPNSEPNSVNSVSSP